MARYTPKEEAYFDALFAKAANKESSLGAGDAVAFLRRSKLDDLVLHEVWDLADTNMCGFLDRESFFRAMKFVAVAQAGMELKAENASKLTALPTFEGLGEVQSQIEKKFVGGSPASAAKFDEDARRKAVAPSIAAPSAPAAAPTAAPAATARPNSTPSAPIPAAVAKAPTPAPAPAPVPASAPLPAAQNQAAAVPSISVDEGVFEETIRSEEMTKYLEAYSHVERDEEGRVSGKRVKQILMRTTLPVALLSRIWLLSDRDTDGRLNREEFVLAMHLAQQAIQGRPLPDKASDTLVNFINKMLPPLPTTTAASAPAAAHAPGATPSPATSSSSLSSSAAGGPAGSAVRWVVTPTEKKMFDDFFAVCDTDRDGFVSGGDVMSTFISSKLHKSDLARVWALCDINKTGRLNSEQFALAMYLISHKVKGIELPTVLSEDHIPPSLRSCTNDPGVKSTPALCTVKLSLGTDAASLQADIAKLRALQQQKETELSELQGEKTSMAAALALARKQVESDRQALAALGPAKVDVSADALKGTQKELAALLAEENRLRVALTAGRAQLGSLQERMAQSRNGVARSQSLSISRFASNRP